MKAMILAAGEGTRLRPLTVTLPKVLLPVAAVPLIEYTLIWLNNHGVSEVAINLHHLGDKIRDSLGDGSRFGMSLSYSPEETLLGTAGGVKRMEPFFADTFVVVCGDILTNFDLDDMVRFHQARNSLATIAVLRVPNPEDVGIVEINEEGRVLSFIEKPPPDSEKGNLGSGGVYVLERKALDYIPAKGSSDFAYDIFPKFLGLDLPVYSYVLKPDDYLIDIGTIDKYQKASEDIKAGRLKTKESKSG